jgi:hypothetical protein
MTGVLDLSSQVSNSTLSRTVCHEDTLLCYGFREHNEFYKALQHN